MAGKTRKKGVAVRAFIVRNVEGQPRGLISKVMGEFAISRQAVHKHLRHLVDGRVLARSGPPGRYQLCALSDSKKILAVADTLQEDIVWRTEVRNMVGELPENVVDLWRYGFTEMFNNVIEHSGSESAFVQVKRTALTTKMILWDKGMGIFNRIGTHLDVIDERHLVVELAKGKVTTEPRTHSGDGIFYTARMFDVFSILSGGIFLTHTSVDGGDDWMFETQPDRSGTLITMTLKNDTPRRIQDIYESLSSRNASGLSTTVVPAHLAQDGTEKLVSRSEARRLLSGIDRFKRVLFDFGGVESIGEAFADEVFRVYAKEHPGVDIVDIRANREVQDMIDGAKDGLNRLKA